MSQPKTDDLVFQRMKRLRRMRLPLFAIVLVNVAVVGYVALSPLGRPARAGAHAGSDSDAQRAAPDPPPEIVPPTGGQAAPPEGDVPVDPPIGGGPDIEPAGGQSDPTIPPIDDPPAVTADVPRDLPPLPPPAEVLAGAAQVLESVSAASSNILESVLDRAPRLAMRPPDAPAMPRLAICNPADTGGPVGYLLDDREYFLGPGERQLLAPGDAWSICFDRGEDHGVEETELAPGVYAFIVTPDGWKLAPIDALAPEKRAEIESDLDSFDPKRTQ